MLQLVARYNRHSTPHRSCYPNMLYKYRLSTKTTPFICIAYTWAAANTSHTRCPKHNIHMHMGCILKHMTRPNMRQLLLVHCCTSVMWLAADNLPLATTVIRILLGLLQLSTRYSHHSKHQQILLTKCTAATASNSRKTTWWLPEQ